MDKAQKLAIVTAIVIVVTGFIFKGKHGGYRRDYQYKDKNKIRTKFKSPLPFSQTERKDTFYLPSLVPVFTR